MLPSPRCNATLVDTDVPSGSSAIWKVGRIAVVWRPTSGCRVIRADPALNSPFAAPHRPAAFQCIYNEYAVFDWDTNNLRKIRAHRIQSEEVEEALSNDPIPIYEQN